MTTMARRRLTPKQNEDIPGFGVIVAVLARSS